MSVEAISIVLHHSRSKGTVRNVLIGIANHQGDGGAWPSIATIARVANCSESTVHRAIRELQHMGELVIERQAGGLSSMKDHERPNRYEVVLACPAQCDRTMNHRMRSYPQATPIPGLEGVSRVTPGVSVDTPGGVTRDTQTVNSTSIPTVPSSVTGPRANAVCRICNRTASVCRRIYADDHAFEPVPHRVRVGEHLVDAATGEIQ